MTREDAIAYGKRVIDIGLNDETQAFCELAIQALKRAERWEKHICFDCKYFSENEEEYDETHCLKCTLIGTEWEQKK